MSAPVGPSGRAIDPCPSCGAVVELVTAVDGVGSKAEPCGHAVDVTIWPGGRFQLAVPPPPEPRAGVDPDVLERATTASRDRHPLNAELLKVAGPMLEAFTEAMVDAAVLGDGWIHITREDGQPSPVCRRVDPARIILVEDQ